MSETSTPLTSGDLKIYELQKQVQELQGALEAQGKAFHDVEGVLKTWTSCPDCKPKLNSYLSDFASTYVSNLGKSQIEALGKRKGVDWSPDKIRFEPSALVRLLQSKYDKKQIKNLFGL